MCVLESAPAMVDSQSVKTPEEAREEKGKHRRLLATLT